MHVLYHWPAVTCTILAAEVHNVTEQIDLVVAQSICAAALYQATLQDPALLSTIAAVQQPLYEAIWHQARKTVIVPSSQNAPALMQIMTQKLRNPDSMPEITLQPPCSLQQLLTVDIVKLTLPSGIVLISGPSILAASWSTKSGTAAMA